MIYSFLYPEIKDEDRNYQFGSVDPVINPSGNWEQALTPFEEQKQNNVEPSSCYIEAQQAAVATLKEFLYQIKDENYSSRFNALLSGGTEQGGDPLKGALSIKKDGLIPQWMMDFGFYIKNWDNFHSWLGVNKGQCISKGQEEANQWDKKYKIIFEKDEDIKDKYAKLKDALTRYACAISVFAWLEVDGMYHKPKGSSDTHLVQVIKLNYDNSLIVKDTYSPFIKVIEPNTDFDFCIGWTVRKLSTEEQLQNAQKNLILLLLEYVKQLLSQIKRTSGEIISGIFSSQN